MAKHLMKRQGVSIRLIPTALAVDAAAKTGLVTVIQQTLSGQRVDAATFNYIGTQTLNNAGGILIDLLGAMAFTKIFPRTPGIRLGRFRVSL